VSGVVEIVRRVVRAELARRRGTTLGVITAIHPHAAEDDDSNYEVDVRLKYEGLELRHVPVAVPHVGVAAPPRIGDLVLVQPIDGDLNQALVTSRFYHDGEPPPLHDEDEILFEHRVPDGTLNHLRFKKDGTILLQRDVTKPEDNSEAKTTVRLDAGGDIRVEAGDDVLIEVKHDAEIKIKCSTLMLEGDMEVTGDLTVKSPSHSTTISGNEIKGA